MILRRKYLSHIIQDTFIILDDSGSPITAQAEFRSRFEEQESVARTIAGINRILNPAGQHSAWKIEPRFQADHRTVEFYACCSLPAEIHIEEHF